jgi:Putative regulator of cell autolysis
MLLNFYLQKVTTENKINNETDLLSQIRDNTDQMIEVTNYATSMLMTNKNTLKNLRILEQDGDSYEIYQAKRELSNDISDVESSVLNAVGGKVAILTKKGYMIGSYTLSRTETNYEKEQWYQEILENGRKITCSTDIGTIFQEMTIYDNVQKYFYMGREILDYSGKNLGIMLIRLSEKKIWGKLAASMVTEEGGALYILDRSNDILMAYNEKYQKQLKELKEQESVKEISDNEITTGNLKDDFYYMEGELENTSNKLVYLVPQKIFLKENRKILQRILEMLLLVIGFTVCTMLYFSKRIAKPLVEVAQTLEKAPNGMAVLEEPQGSFQEMSKFVFCYNQAGKKIEELLGNVERESRLKEKAHYEMLMSQISPHFIFNTVNSIRIMAIKEGQNREGGNENTEKALEALGDILHAVYSNKNGMTTVGQETALLKSYVDIMQMRFGSSFQYYNVIPTELFYYEIPAFTMQPIVENAILHGVKGVTAGQIIVSAIEYENNFVISVFNNGNSVDKKKIEDLLKGEKNQRAVTGIGLYNVNFRLKLLYGESYGLIYNEKVSNGFEIWIRLPKKITESEER